MHKTGVFMTKEEKKKLAAFHEKQNARIKRNESPATITEEREHQAWLNEAAKAHGLTKAPWYGVDDHKDSKSFGEFIEPGTAS